MKCTRPLIGAMVSLAAVVLGGALPLGTATPVARAAAALNGGGSSYAALEISQWRAEVARNPYNLNVNYVAQGSSFGRQQYLSGNLDFAASDIPFQPPELQALANGQGAGGRTDKNFVYVPVSAGGLGFMYNLVDQSGRQVTALNLTRNAVCRIFTEPNMYWSDPEIQNANPTVQMPQQLIRPIVRSDGSGSSYVLSEYCLTVANTVWRAFVNARAAVDTSLDPEFRACAGDATVPCRPTSNWPQGWGVSAAQLGGDGVASAVADSSGLYGITYGEPGAALVRNFPNASLQNSQGVFVQPTEDAASAALAYATGRADGTFQLDYDGPDPTAYFPSTYSYVIAQTTGFPADKGEVLARFLCYSITKGQRKDLTQPLGYARLSAPLVELGKNAIAKIPGAPAWDQCKVESAAPPPAATTIPSGGGGGTTQTTVASGGGGGTTQTTVASGGGGTTQTTVASGGGGGTTQTTVAGGGTDVASGAGGTTSGGATTSGAATGGAATGGATTGGATTGGSTTGGATSGGTTSGGSTSGGVSTDGVTSGGSTVIDPVTGETVPAAVGSGVAADGSCVDPLTGLPADASVCAAASSGAVADGSGAVAGGVVTPVAGGVATPVAGAPVAFNPTIAQDDSGPGTARIIWWLVLGASLCAVGVALAGAGKRLS